MSQLGGLVEGLNDLRYRVATLRADVKFRKLLRAIKGGFDPDQPRDVSGRWSDSGAIRPADAGTTLGIDAEAGAYRFAIAGRQSATYCWNQMQIDMLLCSALQPASRRAICRAQANQRYGACLAGTQIPPLSY